MMNCMGYELYESCDKHIQTRIQLGDRAGVELELYDVMFNWMYLSHSCECLIRCI